MDPRDPRKRPLRPRAGGLATALFLAGLAATALGTRLIGPAQAHPAGDVPAALAHPEAAHSRSGGLPAPRALEPATPVIGDEGRLVNPEMHLPGSMRRGG